MPKKKTYDRDMGDPRFAIARAYDSMERNKAHHLIPEFETKLNQVGGPNDAIRLSTEYSRKAREHFESGHDGARQ